MKHLALLAALAAATACDPRHDTITPDAGSDMGSGSGSAIPLPAGVTAFDGTDSTLPPDDLAPLISLIGDARYIGIGESVHTSGGYYAMKRRLIEDLIQNQGLRVLAMETPRTGAEQLESFIQGTSTNSITIALKYIFPVFVDDNTEALFTWIAAFNQQHPTDPVHFFGFDEQQPDADTAQLQTFLTGAAPADEPVLYGGLSRCLLTEAASYDGSGNPVTVSDADLASCTNGLDALDAYFATNQAALIAASSASAEDLAEVASISLRSWQGEIYYYTSNVKASYEARDIAMHTIFARLRDLYYPGQRIMIWMHDYHLEADHPDVTEDGLDGARNFGHELHAEVGDQYLAIGLIGYDVEINWPNVGNGPLPPPAAGSVEANLHALGGSYFIVDPASAFVGADIATLTASRMIVSQQFGALVYLEHSPPMNALFW